MSKELNRMQELAGVPVKKESLNEHQLVESLELEQLTKSHLVKNQIMKWLLSIL